MTNIPKLRYKEFSNAWEQHKFQDFGHIAMCKRIFKSETFEFGDIPFFKIGSFGGTPDAFISCHLYDEYSLKFAFPQKGNILVSASGSIGKTVVFDGRPAYFQDSNIIWLEHKKEVNDSFLLQLYSIVKWNGIEGSTIKRLYNSNFLNTEFYIPKSKEQAKIGNFFNSLDSLITLHQSRCDVLKDYKKGLLSKMFPNNGYLIPDIRFKGFTDAWEQRELRQLIRKPVTDGPHETPNLLNSGIPFISVEAIHDGVIDLSKARGFISNSDDFKYSKKYKPEIDDVLITKAATIGRLAVIEEKPIFNVWSPIGAIKPNIAILDSKYLFYQLSTDRIQNQAQNSSNEGSQKNLSMSKIEEFGIFLPENMKEQIKISSLFSSLDSLITLHQRKVESLKNLKKALLQEMFVS